METSRSYLVVALEEVRDELLQNVSFKDICPFFVASEFYTKTEVKEILKLNKSKQIEIFLNKFTSELEIKKDARLLICLIDSLSKNYDSLAMKLRNSAERHCSTLLAASQCTDTQFKTLDDNLIKLLFELEMDKYLPVFQAQEIDYPTLLHCSKEDIKELIPKLGPRVKLWEKLEEIRKEGQMRRKARIGSKRNRPHSQTM